MPKYAEFLMTQPLHYTGLGCRDAKQKQGNAYDLSITLLHYMIYIYNTAVNQKTKFQKIIFCLPR